MSWLDARDGAYSEPTSRYMTAQVCLNGHPTTNGIERSPELQSKFCAVCGAETITVCQNCRASIRGDYFVPGVITFNKYHPPRFCHNCGKPLPWTDRAISKAHELADEIDVLNKDEKKKLKTAIDDLTSDSPSTELATVRYKNLMVKAAPALGRAMNNVIVTIATEAAKKMLGL